MTYMTTEPTMPRAKIEDLLRYVVSMNFGGLLKRIWILSVSWLILYTYPIQKSKYEFQVVPHFHPILIDFIFAF